LIESDILKGGELEVVGLLPYASNYTYLARLRRGGREELVVYKPLEGETPLWDFPAGTLCLREVAAYLVSEASGWGLVPPTVLREGPLGVGAVQFFIQHNPITTAFDLLATHQRDLKRIVLFDLLVNNADRKAGHVLLAPDRKLWAVDHGICFHVQPKLRTVLWDFAGQRIPDQERETLSSVAEALDEELAVLLATLLDHDELDALRRRADHLLEAETFPQPGPGRNYPWPPV
jgi:uncharacterized repeat protein (TIGR03843 family)